MKLLAWLQQLQNWLVRLVRWLSIASPVWTCLGVMALGAVAVLGLASAAELTWEQRLRYFGVWLEMAGIAGVAIGLRDTRKLFARPTLWQSFYAWMAKFPPWRVETRVIPGAGDMSARGVAVSISGKAHLTGNETIEQRLATLEDEVGKLRLAARDTSHRIEQESRERERALASEGRERRDEDERIRKLLESSLAGGLYLEMVGVVWLVLGVLFANAAPEIARLF